MVLACEAPGAKPPSIETRTLVFISRAQLLDLGKTFGICNSVFGLGTVFPQPGSPSYIVVTYFFMVEDMRIPLVVECSRSLTSRPIS